MRSALRSPCAHKQHSHSRGPLATVMQNGELCASMKPCCIRNLLLQHNCWGGWVCLSSRSTVSPAAALSTGLKQTQHTSLPPVRMQLPLHARHVCCTAPHAVGPATLHPAHPAGQHTPCPAHVLARAPCQHTMSHVHACALSRLFSCRFDARSEITSLNSCTSDHAAKLEELSAMLKEMHTHPRAGQTLF